MTEKTQTAAVLSALTDPTLLTTQAVALEISHLKELLETRIGAIENAIEVAHEDMVRVPTDVMKQVGTLKELHEEKFKDHECKQEEMKLACLKAETAADLRYSQRFAAQEKALEIALQSVNRAMDIAISRVDKEFHEHLIQVREETKTAFMNSERAIQKAEVANEKRFDGINEFRGQLRDQAATFMPRTESISMHAATAEKISDIMTRLDRQEGRGSGLNSGWGLLLGAVGLLAAVVTIVFTLLRR